MNRIDSQPGPCIREQPKTKIFCYFLGLSTYMATKYLFDSYTGLKTSWGMSETFYSGMLNSCSNVATLLCLDLSSEHETPTRRTATKVCTVALNIVFTTIWWSAIDKRPSFTSALAINACTLLVQAGMFGCIKMHQKCQKTEAEALLIEEV